MASVRAEAARILRTRPLPSRKERAPGPYLLPAFLSGDDAQALADALDAAGLLADDRD